MGVATKLRGLRQPQPWTEVSPSWMFLETQIQIWSKWGNLGGGQHTQTCVKDIFTNAALSLNIFGREAIRRRRRRILKRHQVTA